MDSRCVVLGGSKAGIYNVRPRELAENKYPYPFPIVIHCNNQREADKLFELQVRYFHNATTEDPPARTVVQIVTSILESPAVKEIEDYLDAKAFYAVLYGRKTGIWFRWESIKPLVKEFSGQKNVSFQYLGEAIRYYCYKGRPTLDVEDDAYWYPELQAEGISNVQNEAGAGIVGMTAQLTGLSISPPLESCAAGNADATRDVPLAASTRVNTNDVMPSNPVHTTSPPPMIPASLRTPVPPHTPVPPRPSCEIRRDSLLPPEDWIYLVEREFRDVIRVHTGRRPNPLRRFVASLGPYADYYLTTHGYDVDARLRIIEAYAYSSLPEQFSAMLAPYGAVVFEMEFVYYSCQIECPVSRMGWMSNHVL